MHTGTWTVQPVFGWHTSSMTCCIGGGGQQAERPCASVESGRLSSVATHKTLATKRFFKGLIRYILLSGVPSHITSIESRRVIKLVTASVTQFVNLGKMGKIGTIVPFDAR